MEGLWRCRKYTAEVKGDVRQWLANAVHAECTAEQLQELTLGGNSAWEINDGNVLRKRVCAYQVGIWKRPTTYSTQKELKTATFPLSLITVEHFV